MQRLKISDFARGGLNQLIPVNGTETLFVKDGYLYAKVVSIN